MVCMVRNRWATCRTPRVPLRPSDLSVAAALCDTRPNPWSTCLAHPACRFLHLGRLPKLMGIHRAFNFRQERHVAVPGETSTLFFPSTLKGKVEARAVSYRETCIGRLVGAQDLRCNGSARAARVAVAMAALEAVQCTA
mmetsp:Transcript_94836/g.130553  ORF Transcript_94836/g.130553 Transcript_94836/m.130553 type:complete len:139 (+) Transcript_94836:1126-1542(+)